MNDEKRLQQLQKSAHNLPRNRAGVINQSQLSIDKSRQAPNDYTMSRIEEIRGPSRNVGKQYEKEEISPTVHKRRTKKKVKGVR